MMKMEQKHSPPNPISRRAIEGGKIKMICTISMLLHIREDCEIIEFNCNTKK